MKTPDWNDVMVGNYGKPGITLVKGEGHTVYDDEANGYVDLLGGIAVNILGHAHPAVTKAVTAQAGKLAHTSNLYAHAPGLILAGKLSRLAGGHKVVFCNSGTEANEAALKAIRLHAHDQGRTEGVILAFHDGFHGRTMGALSMTAKPSHRKGFAPLLPNIVHIPFNDTDALASAFMEHDVVGVIAECIQGEGGIRPMDDAFATALQDHCTKDRALLVIDEIQTGIGRTGRFFAYEHHGLSPDIVTVAKGLGGGLPIGACLMAPPVAELFGPGSHGSTFGGNPIACAAANAVLDTIEAEGLIEAAAQQGQTARELLQSALEPTGAKVRGRGLLIGIDLGDRNAKDVLAAMKSKGYLVGSAGDNVVRLAPPINMPDNVLLEAIDALRETVSELMMKPIAESVTPSK